MDWQASLKWSPPMLKGLRTQNLIRQLWRMEMKAEIRYEIVLYWSQTDEAFVAEIPELPGCAADGTTYQEALANAELVIQEWIETAKELGRPVPEPRGRLMYA